MRGKKWNLNVELRFISGGENKSNPDFEDLDRVLLRSIIFSLEILKAEFILYLTIIYQFLFLLLNIFYTR